MVFKLEKYQELLQFIDNIYKIDKNRDISIISVTKSHPISDVKEAIHNGVRIFGENKVQEAIIKYKDLKHIYEDLKLHMIGPLQSNKVKSAIQVFDYFHTLDREKLAYEFSKYEKTINSKFFFIQVNTGRESQKTGIFPEDASEFIQFCKYDLKLNIIGLMCLPPILDDPKQHFSNLQELAFKNNLKHLSMGMSNDYKIALNCKSTFIRIGSLFFGERESVA